MEILLAWVFWLCAVGALYSYFLYPIVLKLLPKRRKAEARPSVDLPRISMIVTAHNEERRIGEKLDNTLKLRYPSERLEIIVASDASTDATDAIVRSYEDRGVRLARASERRGKENAQWHAIQVASGEIIVFSDVATRIPEDALERLAVVFADPRIGAVSSEDRFITLDGQPVGEGLYVRYEMALRRMESEVNSLVGLSGSFFAARREVCQAWDISIPSDFNTALNAVRLGYVAVTDPELLGYYPNIQDERREYQRKFRTVIRGISALARRPDVLNPFKFGLFAFQVWSHKLFRWLVPWFLLGALASCAALAAESPLYMSLLALQVIFYALVLLAWMSDSLRRRTVFKVPFFFIQANVAIAHATLAFLRGQRMTVWTPSAR